MRIWLLTSEFPPHFGGGGISAYCRHFARALVEEAHEVTVFTRAPHDQHDVSEEVWSELYPVVRIPARAERGIGNGLGHWHLLSYAFAREICRRLEAGAPAPDMIEVQDYGGLGYFLQKEKLVGNPALANIPIVVMCHTPTFEIAKVNEEPTYRFPNYWIGRAELFSIVAADRAISPSRFLADRLKERTGREIDVCHLPVFDLYKGNETSAREAQTDLLHVGRYEIRKGVLEMLAGMKALWDAGENIRLLMVGGDTWWPAKSISVWNHIQARYSGYIERGLLRMWSSLDHDEVAGVMQQAKALVVPSLYENFPYVCMEGMSAGVPVIASRSGGQAEMVGDDETCGLVFDWSEPESFGCAVRRMMGMTDAERNDLGIAARERIAAMTDPSRYVHDRISLHEETLSGLVEGNRAYPFLNRFLPAERRLPAYAPQPVEAGARGVLSVVVPYYNLGRYLEETIASVAAATYSPIELVIVNDGSTDPDSVRVLAEVESRKWPFELKVVNIPNGGLANARNVGGKAARGEFLAFLDADDTVRPDYYS
ncbi:MAG TPA: glycosyltransferase, partial [Devosiaceae bacterium]